MPRGFSLEASLTMPASSRPISRASSAIGLPGWYGAIERTYDGDSSHRSIFMSAFTLLDRHRVGAQHLEERRLLAQAVDRPRHRGVLRVTLDVDEEEVFPQR